MMKQRIIYISAALFAMLFLTPQVQVSAESYYFGHNNWEWMWDKMYKDSYGGFSGSGTKNDPYIIQDAYRLAKLAYEVNVRHNTFKGKFFKLSNNINLQEAQVDGYPSLWIPIGVNRKYPFDGYFDGNGKTIAGLRIDSEAGIEEHFSWGLFGACRGGIRNVIIKSANMRLGSRSSSIKSLYAGLLCGYLFYDRQEEAYNCIYGAVYGCTVDGTITGNMTDDIGDRGVVGGLVGYANNPVSIYRCQATLTVRATDMRSIGGIVGFINGYDGSQIDHWKKNWGPLETFVFDCTAQVDIQAGDEKLQHYHAGGICGDNDGGNIEACASSGSITTAKNGTSAGICGRNMGNVIGCVSVARLTGGWNVGGIVGKNEDTTISGKFYYGRIAYCVYSGHLDGTVSRYAGGIAARSSFVGETNSLFLGTMKVGTSCKTHPVSQPTDNKREEDNVCCYFDLNLFNAPSDKDATALPVGTLINGQSNSLPLATANVTTLKNTRESAGAIEVTGVSYQYVEGRYPKIVIASSNNTTAGQMMDATIDIVKAAWDDATELKTPVLFPSYALMAAIPPGFTNTNEAYHLDAPFSVADKTIEDKTFQYDLDAPSGSVQKDGTTVTPLYPGEATLSVTSPERLTKDFLLNFSSGEQWDGTVANNYGGGTGKAGDPYQIYNVRQFVKAMRDNKADEYYKLMGDIWFNKDLYDDNAKPRSGKYAWERKSDEKFVWRAQLDGDGHLIRGLHVTNGFGIFDEIAGTAVLENLAIVNSRVEVPNVYPAYAAFLAQYIHGGAVVRNCLFDGFVHSKGSNARALCYSYLHTPEANVTIEDCVIAIQFNYSSDMYLLGSGNVLKEPSHINRCLVLTASKDIHFVQDVTRTDKTYYHQGYCSSMYVGEDEEYARSAKDLTSGTLYSGEARWQSEPGHYPMLKTFAKTSYGRLLSLPVYSTMENRITDMKQSTEFGYGSTAWSSNNDAVEVDNDALVMVPLKDEDCYLVRQLDDAHVLLPIRLGSGCKMGITFADEHAKNVCTAHFDTDGNQQLMLRELNSVTASALGTAMASSEAEASQIEKFLELSYFTGITALGADDASARMHGAGDALGATKPFKNLQHLKEVRLPGNITALYDGAFEGCTDLETVTLPSKLTTVKGHPFYGSSVKTILVDSLNSVYQSRDGMLLTKTGDLVCYPNGRSGTSITLSGNIGNILPNAIYKIDKLDSIFIDNPGADKLTYLQNNGITHYSGEAKMRVYINDGTEDATLYKRYMNNDTWADIADAGLLGRYYPLTFNDAKAATLYLGFDTQLPADQRVYLVSKDDTDEKTAMLLNISKKIDNKLAKKTAVVVRSPYAGIVKLFPYTGADVVTIPLYLNGLNGVGEKGLHVNQGDSNQGNCLTLGRNSQMQLGFFYFKNNFIQPYHAYLTVNSINARMVEFDDVTDLDITDVSEEPTQEVEADLFDDLFAYKKSDDGKSCRAVWYYGDPQNITIPAEVEGIPVTAMGKNVFYGNEEPVWSVTVPSSIKTLRVARREKDNPFYGLNDSTIVYLPSADAGYTMPDDEWNVVMGDQCKRLYIADEQSFIPPHDFYADYVQYTRSLWAETDIVSNYESGDLEEMEVNGKDGTNEALAREVDFDLFDIQYKRKAYAVCLPFDVDLKAMEVNDESVLKAYQLKYVKDNLHFIFVEVPQQLKAGEPYFIVVDGGGFMLTNDQKTKISTQLHPQTVTDYNTGAIVGQFKGVLSFLSNEEAIADHAYIIQQSGNWHRIANQTAWQRQARVWPFRTYFSRSDGFVRNRYFTNYQSAASQARQRVADDGITDFPTDAYYSDIDFEVEDDATSIRPVIHTIDLDGTEHMYDLSGSPLNSKPTKGAYIKNGKKYIHQ